MTDYEQLVKALRGFDMVGSCPCDYSNLCENFECITDQAAAAIEALEDELADENSECDYLVNENARLTTENNELKAAIKRLEPKQGEWIDDGLKYGIHWFKCSSCGESQDIPTVMLKPYYHYCPNCGAKMEGQDA